MTTKQQELMTNLLRSNLLISTGCTETIAIAYASAVARSYLKEEPSKITLRISKNMAKNAMDEEYTMIIIKTHNMMEYIVSL